MEKGVKWWFLAKPFEILMTLNLIICLIEITINHFWQIFHQIHLFRVFFFLSWNFRWTMADIQICEVLLHELAKFKYHSIEVATNHGSSNWLTSNGNLVSKARWHKKKLNMLPRALRCIVPKLDGMAKGVKFNFSCCYERFHLELIASVNLGMSN